MAMHTQSDWLVDCNSESEFLTAWGSSWRRSLARELKWIDTFLGPGQKELSRMPWKTLATRSPRNGHSRWPTIALCEGTGC